MSSVLSAQAITFRSDVHEYWLDGRRVPSVTEILKATGVSTDFEALGAMSDRLRGQIEFKRDLGSALHADIHAYDDGDLVWESVDERVLPYLDAWVSFRHNSGLKPVARERIVFHPSLHYCGTFDGIFERPDGGRILLDVKTGDPHDSACHLQTAAYLLAYLCEHPGVTIVGRQSVQLMPDRLVPYAVTPYLDYHDFTKWPAVVTTFYEQANRRSRHV
jgi:hypothetical protein